jgi:hypothetical protein
MNDRISVGIHATSARALAYRPEHLDEPRAHACEEGMDDTGDFAVTKAEASPLLLSTPALLAEVDTLALRIVRRETRARDVLLVQALAARLKTATAAAQPTNREPLDGMLMLDIDEQPSDDAFALDLSKVMQRVAPPEIAAIFANSEFES